MAKLILSNHNDTSVFSELIGKKVISIKEINLGLMNYVFEATCEDSTIYFIKQALREAKEKQRISKNLALISVERIENEFNTLKIMHNYKPSSLRAIFPEIISFNKKDNILVTKDLNKNICLQHDLENGIFDPYIARNISLYLSNQHAATFNKKIIIRRRKDKELEHWDFFLSLRTKDLLTSSASFLEKELEETYNNGIKHSCDVLLHMDFCPKNIIYNKKKQIAIVDFEFSSGIGDPAYDMGFMLGHYLVFAIVKTEKQKAICAIYDAFRAYIDNVSHIKEFGDIEKRIWKYAACTMLYRIVGASPASYILPTFKNDILYASKQLLQTENVDKNLLQKIISQRQ